MNYYLARDGQTYGPYPQESFPAMMKEGQVVPEDLVCPEGGSDWVAVSTVPALNGARPAPTGMPTMPGLAAPVVASSSKTAGIGPMMPTVAASSSNPMAMPAVASSSSTPAATPNKLRISGAAHAKPHAAASPPATGEPGQEYPKAVYPQQEQHKPGLMEKAAGAWGLLKIVGVAVVVLIVVISVIAGYIHKQGDKKAIAKLHALPGWQEFNAGNSQIDSETTTAGFGNTSESKLFAEGVAAAVEIMQRTDYPPPAKSRYRGRSKLGRITSAVNSATSTTGKPEVYVEKRGGTIITLIHVPDFSRYSSSTRQELCEACWGTTHTILGGAMASAEKMREQLAAQPPSAAPPAARTGRPATGRTRTPAATAPVASSSEPAKAPPELKLVVGVRGESDYECVYIGKVTAKGDEPAPMVIKENVPSHQELVKWFGTRNSSGEKPQGE